MGIQTQQLFDEAVKLSPSERAELADALLESIPSEELTSAPSEMDPVIVRAWGRTVEKRMADAEAGHVQMIPHKAALPTSRV